MALFHKVKKLGSKLFGDSPEKRDDMVEDARSGSVSAKVAPLGSSGKLTLGASGRKQVDMMDLDVHAAAGGSFSRGMGIPAVHAGNQDGPSSPSGKGACMLPPVQGSGNSHTSQHSNASSGAPSPKQVMSSMMAANANGSGRRKSTPAALDMALRSAEGKQAIEELINSAGKKQMVFGQYFGNASKPATAGIAQGSPVEAKGTTSSRFGKAAGAAGSLSPISAGMPGQPMHAVAEDEDMIFAPEQQQQPSTTLIPPQQLLVSGSVGPGHLHAHYMQQRPISPASPSAIASASSPHLLSPVAAAHPAGAQPMAVDAPAPYGVAPLTIPAAAAAAAASPRPVTTPQKRPAEPVSNMMASNKQPVLHMPHTPSFAAPAPAPPAQPVHEAPAPAPQPPQVQPHPPPAPAPQPPPSPARQTKVLAMATQLPAGMARPFWSLSDYSIMRKMYTGYASTVYQATCKKSLEQVALKVYHMENLCELNHYQVYREIRVHSSLAHQHIIQLYCAFQEGNDVVMVQEYAEGGDLYRLLHRNGGRLSERQAVEMVLHPFLLALHYLHTRGIMHRDIKPENVLFTEHRVLKLADFGLAIDLTEERAVTRAGTLDYMAPEVLRCPPKNLPQENKNNVNLHYNNSVDAWAVGVFAFELIVGFPPFAGESQLASVDKIIHATPEFPEKVSELAKSFITAALKKHPGDRPSVMEMLHHPWIRSYQRRTSVRIPQMMRRRSSVQYPQGLGGLAPQMENPANIDNMTPEEIEHMIQRLQMQRNPMAEHGV